MKSWDFSRVLPLWLSILILILMPVFRLFRHSGFYFLPHGIQVSSFMSVLIFLSIDWNEKLHFSFYPSIVWLPGAFRLWVTCLNCVPLQCCRTFSRHQIIEQISFGELHSLEVVLLLILLLFHYFLGQIQAVHAELHRGRDHLKNFPVGLRNHCGMVEL